MPHAKSPFPKAARTNKAVCPHCQRPVTARKFGRHMARKHPGQANQTNPKVRFAE